MKEGIVDGIWKGRLVIWKSPPKADIGSVGTSASSIWELSVSRFLRTEHFAVSPIASLSLWKEGLAKCWRKENDPLSLEVAREVVIEGESEVTAEQLGPREDTSSVTKVHCRPRERQREHGEFRSHDTLAKKHSSQERLFLPGLAAGGAGWLNFLAQVLICLRATSLSKH